jgi:hypothetical protein
MTAARHIPGVSRRVSLRANLKPKTCGHRLQREAQPLQAVTQFDEHTVRVAPALIVGSAGDRRFDLGV